MPSISEQFEAPRTEVEHETWPWYLIASAVLIGVAVSQWNVVEGILRMVRGN